MTVTPSELSQLPALIGVDQACTLLGISRSAGYRAAGVPAKVVSERLGHANIAITMDTYSHVLPGMDEARPALWLGSSWEMKRRPARVP
jgi:integrase